uniref:Interleukin-12 subunit beta n=1 Tax=Periophthalmus magnuspinnatus TaxID=409849 RepID=A0A3B4AHB9_9GOBI
DFMFLFFSFFLDVVAKEKATLTCETQEQRVTWRLNGKPLEDGDFGDVIHVNGPVVTVDEIDDPVLGEYTCWSAAEHKISSTFLLQELDVHHSLESLKCEAKSYDCFFTCAWRDSGYDSARLYLGRDCESCPWVNGNVMKDGSFQFDLFHSLSPYAEETTMMELTVEALHNFSILKRTKRFYLRDIIKPDSPRIAGYLPVQQELNVTIEPPSTWSSPHSFFSLENEIEYVLKDNGEVKSPSALIPRKISKFRVRCRDSYALSAWSHWTPWKNVKKGKGTKKNSKCSPGKKCKRHYHKQHKYTKS